MAEKSLVSALANGKCPRCREGKMFTFPITHPTKFNRMNERCLHCGAMLQPEPGFYQGAMYVGYAFTVAVIFVLSFTLYYLFDDPPDGVYIGTIIGASILLAPLNYRYSRIVYLHAFGGIKYDPSWSK